MTRYDVEPCPGQPRDARLGWEGSGWRVVAITGDVRRPMLVRYRRKAHARAEARRLQERDALLVSGAKARP